MLNPNDFTEAGLAYAKAAVKKRFIEDEVTIVSGIGLVRIGMDVKHRLWNAIGILLGVQQIMNNKYFLLWNTIKFRYRVAYAFKTLTVDVCNVWSGFKKVEY